MPVSFSHVCFETAVELPPRLEEFYAGMLGLEIVDARAGALVVAAGETTIEFRAGAGRPFYHYAFLVPGDRFDAAHRFAAEHVEILRDEDTGAEIFDFENWDAQALYFHDPAGSIVELIAHRGVGESGAVGPFLPRELLGVSEVGVVGEPARLADALATVLALPLWSGSVSEAGSLAFVGEKARTLILSPAGRPWLPTGRAAEAHPIEVVLAGAGDGEAQLAAGIVVRGAALPRTG